jgi:hypothetical protein
MFCNRFNNQLPIIFTIFFMIMMGSVVYPHCRCPSLPDIAHHFPLYTHDFLFSIIIFIFHFMGLQMKMMGNDGQHGLSTLLPIIFTTFFMKMMGRGNNDIVTRGEKVSRRLEMPMLVPPSSYFLSPAYSIMP